MANQELYNQAMNLANRLFISLRKNVLREPMFSWQEVSLVVDCFIKMQELLPYIVNHDEKYIAFELLELYSKNFKKDIDIRFELQNLHIIPYFESLITHLYDSRVLKITICHIVNEIDILKKSWENSCEDDSNIITSSQGSYSPDECLLELSKEFSKHKKLTCAEEFRIACNYKKEFYSLPYGNNFSVESRLLETEYSNSLPPRNDRRIKFEEAVCVWPFCCGYARILRKDGRWGFISMENNSIKLLADNILYANDYCCDRAKVQYTDSNSSFSYIGLSQEDCFNRRFIEASDFVGGYALVSDEYCNNFKIDVWGNVAQSDKLRYEANRKSIIKEKEQSCHAYRKRTIYVSDPESEIMDSLSGHGADSELYGF